MQSSKSPSTAAVWDSDPSTYTASLSLPLSLQVTMLDSIPGLMNAIRMINSYSRYYNTSEHMTTLFVKVTNQMIAACRAHITDSGYSKLWELEKDVVLQRLADCKHLNDEYVLCFHRTKEKLKSHPEEKPFDFSEVYIFGKFSNFCRRCVQKRFK